MERGLCGLEVWVWTTALPPRSSPPSGSESKEGKEEGAPTPDHAPNDDGLCAVKEEAIQVVM